MMGNQKNRVDNLSLLIMNLFISRLKKIFLLIFISMLIFGVWEYGVEKVYEKALVGVTNVTLKVVKKDTRIELEKTTSADSFQFRVYTQVQGRKGNYPQETGGLMEPFVIVLSWQLFLFFVIKWKNAAKLMAINIGIFLFFQVLFLIFLTGYYNSSVQQFLFDMMLDNFYIVALILVIKDNMIFPVFKKSTK